MRDELTQKLYTDFPDLYHEHTLSMSETSMCWGFAVDDGWYNIIYKLSERITAIVSAMPEANPKDFCAVQVKEKYGGLRFYMRHSNGEIRAAIGEAEDEASHTCERCGKEGELRDGGWYVTLCDSCNDPEADKKEEGEKEDDDEK